MYDKDYIKTMKRWKNTSGRSSIVDDGGPGEEHFTVLQHYQHLVFRQAIIGAGV